MNLGRSGFLLFAYLLSLPVMADSALQPTAAEYGPSPTLPPPEKSLIPTINVSKAVRWSGEAMPRAAHGTQVSAVARGCSIRAGSM
jgi:hypothetical protein